MLFNILNLLTLANLAIARTVWTGPPSEGDNTSPIQNSHAPAAPAAGSITYSHFDCGTDKTGASHEFLSTLSQLYSSSPSRVKRTVKRKSSSAGPLLVNLYMHVVATTDQANMVSKGQMAQEFAVMNKAYKQINVQFALKNTSWTVNNAWATGANSTMDIAMKSALRQGSYDDLNLYFQTNLTGGILGYCDFPSDQGSNPPPSQYVGDGCNIAAGTVPGGSFAYYNLGMTAVHETGHWFGLLHTFENYSCYGDGDYISDTPFESQSTNGCPTSPPKNTCASTRKGVDPIHNYMDYSTDACYNQFTPGQGARVTSLWSMYRQGM